MMIVPAAHPTTSVPAPCLVRCCCGTVLGGRQRRCWTARHRVTGCWTKIVTIFHDDVMEEIFVGEGQFGDYDLALFRNVDLAGKVR